jgi:hypothetical protein
LYSKEVPASDMQLCDVLPHVLTSLSAKERLFLMVRCMQIIISRGLIRK